MFNKSLRNVRSAERKARNTVRKELEKEECQRTKRRPRGGWIDKRMSEVYAIEKNQVHCLPDEREPILLEWYRQHGSKVVVSSSNRAENEGPATGHTDSEDEGADEDN